MSTKAKKRKSPAGGTPFRETPFKDTPFRKTPFEPLRKAGLFERAVDNLVESVLGPLFGEEEKRTRVRRRR